MEKRETLGSNELLDNLTKSQLRERLDRLIELTRAMIKATRPPKEGVWRFNVEDAKNTSDELNAFVNNEPYCHDCRSCSAKEAEGKCKPVQFIDGEYYCNGPVEWSS